MNKTNKKYKKITNENFKIKISETDIKNFPTKSLKIDDFWKSLYEGN